MNNAEDYKTQFAEYAPAQYDVACYPYEDCCQDEFLGDDPEQARAWLEATWKRWLP